MRKTHSLKAIRLLRRIEMQHARKNFGAASQADALATARDAQAAAALRIERQASLSQDQNHSAADLSAWLPVAVSVMNQAAEQSQKARTNLATAQRHLAEAGRAEQAIINESTRRTALQRITRLKRDQIEIDDLRVDPVKPLQA